MYNTRNLLTKKTLFHKFCNVIIHCHPSCVTTRIKISQDTSYFITSISNDQTYEYISIFHTLYHKRKVFKKFFSFTKKCIMLLTRNQ